MTSYKTYTLSEGQELVKEEDENPYSDILEMNTEIKIVDKDSPYATHTIIMSNPARSVCSWFSWKRFCLGVLLCFVIGFAITTGVFVTLYVKPESNSGNGGVTSNQGKNESSTNTSLEPAISSNTSATPNATTHSSTSTTRSSTTSPTTLTTTSPTSTTTTNPTTTLTTSVTTTTTTSPTTTTTSPTTTTTTSPTTIPTSPKTTTTTSSTTTTTSSTTTTTSPTTTMTTSPTTITTTSPTTTTTSSTTTMTTSPTTTTTSPSTTTTSPTKTMTTSPTTTTTSPTTITTTSPTTTMTTSPTTTTTPHDCSTPHRCHTCTSHEVNGRCKANGQLVDTVKSGMSVECSMACFAEVRAPDQNYVHRGCVSSEGSKVQDLVDPEKPGCFKIEKWPGAGVSTYCFCCGDLCNTQDMTKYGGIDI